MERSLDAEDWQRIEALFHDALAQPADTREAWLDAALQRQPQLRAEVEALLQAEAQQTAIAGGIAREAGALSIPGLSDQDRLSHYRIVRKLDEGGMGAVYEAERADGAFSQRVAIKVLHAALATDALIERFQTERQILARLQHPNIAGLLDGGTSEQGLPYLVMEYVEGEHITDYCEGRGLDIAARLELIRSLCSALDAAHRQLIVHRDIKPSNVLVQADGQLKLLDFGIAKLLRHEASDETQMQTRLMTPDYASPEQILGETISTATDVYAVGALSYRLLTGRTAFHQLRARPLDLQRAVCETQPVRPSQQRTTQTGAIAPAWPRRLAADLDAIILRAMRRSPEDRYSSIAALSADLENLLGGRPVAARAGTRRYLIGKFVERNARALSAATAVVVLIVGIVSNYTLRLQSERESAVDAREAAEQAQAQAELERATAEQVSDFMVGLFDGANTDRQRPNLRVSELLDAGAARLDKELTGTPLVQARLLFALGHADWTLGRLEIGEQRMRRAIALFREHAAGSTDLADALATLSYQLVYVGDFDDGEALTREALAIYEHKLGLNHPRVADMLSDIDRILGRRDHDNSDARFATSERARHIYETASLQNTDAYGILIGRQSSFHKQRFEWEEAVRKASVSLSVSQQVHGDDHYYVGITHEDLGRIHYFRGTYDQALASFQSAISTIEAFKGLHSNQYGWALYFAARIWREIGAHQRARSALERLVAIEQDDPTTADNRYLARALCGLALVLADVGELDEAERQARRGHEILLRNDQRVVQLDVAHEALGTIALAQGDVETGLTQMRALATLRREEHDPGQTDTPLALAQQAAAEQAAGHTDVALALLDEAEQLALTRYDANYPNLGRIHFARAALRLSQGDEDGARADRAQAERIFARHQLVPQDAVWRIPPRKLAAP